MFRLISRPALRRAAARAPKLRLVRLETRDCPAAPVVVSLSITPVDADHVLIAGVVQDESASSCVVQLGGSANVNFTPGADGSFSVTTTLATGDPVSAQATDTEGLQSPVVLRAQTLNQKPVIIQFSASEQSGRVWMLSGRVIDEAPSGLTVTFHSSISGLNNVRVTADDYGQFEYAYQAPPQFKGGDVSADTTDMWGLAADTVSTHVG